MIKRLALMALIVVTAGAPLKAGDRVDRMLGRENAQGEKTPKGFRHWADTRLHGLREDFDRFDKRVEKYGPSTEESFKDKLGELEQRVAKDEGRLKEVGDRNDKSAWKTREDLRDDIKDIREDFRGLNRKLERK